MNAKHRQVQETQRQLQQTIDHLRRAIDATQEPQLKAIMETSAEVIGGLVKTFQDYERKTEPAWR